jgi:ribosome-binding protein aMBF1 (putative translation factor)
LRRAADARQCADDEYILWQYIRHSILLIRMKRKIDIRQRFGQRVRELRKAKSLSQEGFAAKCGIDRTYVGGIERGIYNPALRKIEAIADALGVSLSELMRGL